jgi:hypothetical protein
MLAPLFTVRSVEAAPTADNPRWSRRAHHIGTPYQLVWDEVSTLLEHSGHSFGPRNPIWRVGEIKVYES